MGRKGRKHTNIGRLGALVAICPETLNKAEKVNDEWEEVIFAVESGATETVVPSEMARQVEVQEGEAYRRGVQYEVASGSLIPNEGEKRFEAVSGEGVARNMVAQVCGVSKALMSVSKVTSAGHRVVFEQGNSYIEDMTTEERIYLK